MEVAAYLTCFDMSELSAKAAAAAVCPDRPAAAPAGAPSWAFSSVSEKEEARRLGLAQRIARVLQLLVGGLARGDGLVGKDEGGGGRLQVLDPQRVALLQAEG